MRYVIYRYIENFSLSYKYVRLEDFFLSLNPNFRYLVKILSAMYTVSPLLERLDVVKNYNSSNKNLSVDGKNVIKRTLLKRTI